MHKLVRLTLVKQKIESLESKRRERPWNPRTEAEHKGRGAAWDNPQDSSLQDQQERLVSTSRVICTLQTDIRGDSNKQLMERAREEQCRNHVVESYKFLNRN